ncbi:MAG: hypothetical protein Fur0021_14380 [Candidatus Promineifilaceae bacterium]
MPNFCQDISQSTHLRAQLKQLEQEWNAPESSGIITESFLTRLAQLSHYSMLSQNSVRLSAPACGLLLADIDGDGQVELIAACQDGKVHTFSWRENAGSLTQRLPPLNLPTDLRPLIGLQTQSLSFENVQTVQLFTRTQQEDIRYEIYYAPDGNLGQQQRNYPLGDVLTLALGRSFGSPTPGGLRNARLLVDQTGQGWLETVSLLEQRASLPFHSHPLGLVHTANRVWLADSCEIIRAWQWADDQLQNLAGWPATGLPTDGAVTALSLWRTGDASWLLLAATNERWLIAYAETGAELIRIRCPHVITAIVAQETEGALFLGFENATLTRVQVNGVPFVSSGLPALPEAIGYLPAAAQDALLAQWLAEEEIDYTEAAITVVLARIPPSDYPALEQTLQQLIPTEPDALSSTAQINILTVLEQAALQVDDVGSPLITFSLRLARRWQPYISLRLSRRVDLLTARLAARFRDNVIVNPDYQALQKSRYMTDLELAQHYAETSQDSDPVVASRHLEAALALYARMLIERRQIIWRFATNKTIRAVQPLKGAPHIVLTTRSGRVYQIDINQRFLLTDDFLEKNIVPRALAMERLFADNEYAIAIATTSGDLYISSTIDDYLVAKLRKELTVSHEINNLAIVPRKWVPHPRLVICYGGRLVPYESRDNGWQPLTAITLAADQIYCLAVQSLAKGEPPVMLAGGAKSDGQGVLYLLDLDGNEIACLDFAGIVIDVRTTRHNEEKSAIVVASNDGFVYLLRKDGMRYWRFQAGSAAHGLHNCDVDNDGAEEIIVGGERYEHGVYILDRQGAVKWHLPASAPVTHVSSLVDNDGRPLLLKVNLDHTLQVQQLIPPGSQQEKEIRKQARACLGIAAAQQQMTPPGVITSWLSQSDNPYLRALACQMLLELDWVTAEQAVDYLLALPMHAEENLVKRAYARTLVQLAADSRLSIAKAQQIGQHLAAMLQSESPPRIIGVAVLRQFMISPQPPADRLAVWQPVLQQAAGLPDAEARRTVLYALRQITYYETESGSLPAPIWEILYDLLTRQPDEKKFLAEDVANFLRDTAPGVVELWVLGHRALVELGDQVGATILEFLGQQSLPIIDSKPLAAAFCHLAQLQLSQTLSETRHSLRALLDAVNQAGISAAVADRHANNSSSLYVDVYRLLEQGLMAQTYEAWERYINDRLPDGGLGHLSELLNDPELYPDAGISAQVDVVRDAIRHCQETSPAASNSLNRLKESLTETASRLLHLRGREASGQRPQTLLWAKALAAVLEAWTAKPGPLQEQIAYLTRPPELKIEPVEAVHRNDELVLELNICNTSPAIEVRDLSIRLHESQVRYAQYENLRAHPADATQIEGLLLAPRARYRLRLRVVLPAREKTTGSLSSVTLSFSVRYFIPYGDWQPKNFEVEFEEIKHIASATLVNLEQKLPRAVAIIRADLRQKMQTKSLNPILVEATPLIRTGVINMLRDLAPQGAPSSVVDMRLWLHEQNSMHAQKLEADEGAFLAWFAESVMGNVNADRIRAASAPRLAFADFMQRQSYNLNLLILNNWERLLFAFATAENQWQPLADLLPYLVSWSEQAGIRLVFIGTFLSEQITLQRWPELRQAFSFVRCDQVPMRDAHLREELEQAVQHILDERSLQPVLKRFSPPITAADLVWLCGGYLHFLSFVCLEGLEMLQNDLTLQPGNWIKYFVNVAHQINFFNALWLWQDFFDRVAIMLAANGEIPLQDKGWVEAGLTLSRDYYSRSPDGRQSRAPVLPADHLLREQDLNPIRSNLYYRSQDIWVRGFSLERPLPPQYGSPGELFVQLLHAAGGVQRLERLAEAGILRRNRTRALGTFYEIKVPLYGYWLRENGIWEHMLAAAQSGLDTWYPPQLTLNHRPNESQKSKSLFPELQTGSAHRDIPLDMVPTISQVLNADRNSALRPLFLNLYGLKVRERGNVHQRWEALANLLQAINSWQAEPTSPLAEDRGNVAAQFLGSLLTLLGQEQVKGEPLQLLSGAAYYPAAFMQFSHQAKVLRKEFLFLLVKDGKQVTTQARLFHTAIRNWFETHHKVAGEDNDKGDLREKLARSVVFVVVAAGIDVLRRALNWGRLTPHLILLPLSQLRDFAISQDPINELINHAFTIIGRQSFSPYRLVGSLTGGSPLFVGRDRELNRILLSLDREDHAILGSRRIGKTSLLHELAYRIGQQENSHQNVLSLFLRLRDNFTDADFYVEIKNALDTSGLHQEANRLAKTPNGNYNDLRDVMQQLATRRGHPVVFLIDEIDGLYLWDRDSNNQRLFQFLRNNLAQAQPRTCTFIMTGYRHIFLDRQQHGSVFFNFCYFHNFAAIQAEGVERLVSILEELNLSIEDRDSVTSLITQETYAIPYYVQRTCDDLLRRADRLKLERITPDDVRLVLEHDIKQELKRELWDDLLTQTVEWHRGEETGRYGSKVTQNLKTKVILLSMLLHKYQHKFRQEYTRTRGVQDQVIFTTGDIIANLREFDASLVDNLWMPTQEEVNHLLRPLSMTLALTPANTEFPAYEFPNGILPDLLFHFDAKGDIDLVDELDSLVKQLKHNLESL